MMDERDSTVETRRTRRPGALCRAALLTLHPGELRNRRPWSCGASLCLFVLLLSTLPVLATTTTITADRDSRLSETAGSSNFGSDSKTIVKEKSGDSARAVYHFDLASLPAAESISSATLKLWVTQSVSSAVDVHRITDSWTESGVTWDNTAADFDATADGSFTPSTTGAYVSVDITSLVQEWDEGTSPNHGVMLISQVNDEESKYTTREWGTSSERPELVVVTSANPVGGYTTDDVIPAAQINQSTDGLGIVTINWKGRDDESDNVTLNTFEYSVDGGAIWNAPTTGDASAALSVNWDDNGGSGWSTATTFASATAHSFTFDTQHADVSGLSGVDQSDVRIRFKLNDGTGDSASFATSENFRVDNEAPTDTITSASYQFSTDTMTITGTDFLTIAAASTEIKTYMDWSKFVWDINGDNATTTDVTFVVGDISSLVVTNDTTLTLVFTSAKATAIESDSDYGSTGGDDTLDVTAGWSKDAFGNVATTDGHEDAPLATPGPQLTIVKSSSVISDPVNGGTNPLRIPGSVVEYSVVITNNGDGSPDVDTVKTTDPIDSSGLAYDVTTGVTFTDGSTSSALSLGTVEYSSTAAPGPYVYDYTPVPDGDGYDGNVTSVRINTTGTFANGGAPAPSFTVKFRVKVK